MKKSNYFKVSICSTMLSAFLLLTLNTYCTEPPVKKNQSKLVKVNFFKVASDTANSAIIIDTSHYSSVFAEVRNYRIFLPPAYFSNPLKRYPVIYFYHGWSERFFGVTGTAGYDKGAENNGDNIANYVAKHDVIVVKPDGFNANDDEAYKLQPYNVDPVVSSRQFPIYFPEFVKYIDTHFKTIADRNHRAVSGLSMGGFMTFVIAGKYPDMVSAAGNFCGSYEFFIGPYKFPVEYCNAGMYNNYNGVNVRLNYGDKDNLRFYHQDMNRIWTQVLNNYAYKIYDAQHITCGMSEMFDFILETFKYPPAKPQRWNHIDIYPEFLVWDYSVSSDRFLPGFTVLENVDKRGFRCSVRQFIPDGELMPMVNLSITTAPIYEKNKLYLINDVDSKGKNISQKKIFSDGFGRIKIQLNGGIHNVGINKELDKPNISIASFNIINMNWAVSKKEVAVSLIALNKGMQIALDVKANIIAFRNNTEILKQQIHFGDIGINEIKKSDAPFFFKTKSDSIEISKFKISIYDNNKNTWSEYIEVPVKKELGEIKDFEIADGRYFTVVKAGVDSESVFLGRGNGDGIANPGESFVVLIKSQNKYYRSNLFTTDQYINPSGVNKRLSDSWEAYDGIGPSAKYNIPLIAADCPEGHVVNFAAEYWEPENRNHLIKQGAISVPVTGIDKTAPIIEWVHITGDNTVQVKLCDGANIKFTTARFIPKENLKDIKDNEVQPLKNIFIYNLNDSGINGDRIAGDNVFSFKIPAQTFYMYHVEITAADVFGNEVKEMQGKTFVVH